jgi:hypothetical protein
MKTLLHVLGLLVLALALVSSAGATPISVTLDTNWNDYHSYSYAVNGTTYTLPTGPYPAILTGGVYGSGTLAYLICFDINVDTYIGQTYWGSLTVPEDTPQIEVAWLMDQLGLAGGYYAPVSTSGPISMAIWQLEDPSSVNSTPFVEDPAAQPWVAAAINAVNVGDWQDTNAAQHPFWSPDDPGASQRFGIVSVVPEPGSSALVGASLIGLGLLFRKRLKNN